MSGAVPGEHPERALVRRAIEAGLKDLPVTTNPLARALAMRLLEARAGWVRLAFTVPDDFTQGNGVVQGGIVAGMLDFGMVFAAFSQVPVEATLATVAQTTNFFRAAMAGELLVEAELEKVGRTLINARASLRSPDGVLLAGATAPIAVIAQRRSG